jgi:hypothetical protein
MAKSHLEKLAEEALQKEQMAIEQAKKRIPEQYHDFLMLLDEDKLLAKFPPRQNENLPENVYEHEGKTFIKIKVPYVSVDGRLKMFADAHDLGDGKRAKYKISSNIEFLSQQILEKGSLHSAIPLVVKIESEIFGQLENVARIFWNGEGANRSNPLETAYTSALGRAIAEAGFGLIGTGICSAEEVEAARNFRDAQKKSQQQGGEDEKPDGDSQGKGNDNLVLLLTQLQDTPKGPHIMNNIQVWTVPVKAQFPDKTLKNGLLYIPENLDNIKIDVLNKNDVLRVKATIKPSSEGINIWANDAIKNQTAA